MKETRVPSTWQSTKGYNDRAIQLLHRTGAENGKWDVYYDKANIGVYSAESGFRPLKPYDNLLERISPSVAYGLNDRWLAVRRELAAQIKRLIDDN